MEYAIIHVTGSRDTLGRLEAAVNDRIKQGWSPQGGVSFVDTPTFVSVSQAMVREMSEKRDSGERSE